MGWGFGPVAGWLGQRPSSSSSSASPPDSAVTQSQAPTASALLAASSQAPASSPNPTIPGISSRPASTTSPSTPPGAGEKTVVARAAAQDSSAGESTENFWLSARSRRQFTVFAAGAAFLAISLRITKRSLRRKYLQNFPAFYHPSNAPPKYAANGAVEALEALAVASINVFSSGLMLTGGMLWALDISTLEDARRRVHAGLGVDETGSAAAAQQKAEQELEEWIADTLDRKRRKDHKDSDKDAASIVDREDVQRAWRK